MFHTLYVFIFTGGMIVMGCSYSLQWLDWKLGRRFPILMNLLFLASMLVSFLFLSYLAGLYAKP